MYDDIRLFSKIAVELSPPLPENSKGDNKSVPLRI
jgi:hypothetical protein